MARRAWTVVLAGLAALAAGCSAVGGRNEVDDGGCEAGFHACGADCFPDASPLSCGTRCAPCPVPENGDAICAAGAVCWIDCHPGFHECGGGCVDDTSVTACGAGCESCPAPGGDHARAACIAGACGHSCDLGWLVCATGCCAAPTTGSPHLALGALTSCAVGTGDILRCWGSNGVGGLGSGAMSPDFSATPVPVAGFTAGSVAQVAYAFRHACAVETAGVVRCWGGNGFGELGDGSHADAEAAVTVLGVSSAVAAAGGWEHSCALLGNGTVRCWGNGEAGVLGDGHVYGGDVPGVRTVKDLAGASALLSGYQFGCAITGAATMECWGSNLYGQLGTAGLHTVEAEPEPVVAVSDVTALRAVALGTHHTCVAYDLGGASGAVRCWGRNDAGQLGNGQKATAQLAPVEVTGLSGVTALAAGDDHTCALTAGGAVRCWGRNLEGQLGDGTQSERLSPAWVSGLTSGVRAIAAGYHHTCALMDTAQPSLKCWGANEEGQLGDGTRNGSLTPVSVVAF